jgi:mRNA interferase RelE/StbE
MPYRVVFNAYAARAFRKLPKAIQNRLRPAIDALKDDPRPPGTEKLSGMDAAYRIRVGDYRVLYEIRDGVLLVLVVDVGPRREIYR